ncbi:MAG: DUF2786 domain-containing protein [Lentisphaeria bacterium]|nr:DUF2786 domain-containing protein [Lentisphaeria bacterium]
MHTPPSAELDRRILVGLDLEWDTTISFLPYGKYRIKTPFFSLSDGHSLLGQWVGAPIREIRISRHLVYNHPWYAVVDVLKHEMAHQFAEEVLGARGQRPHGDLFHQACRILGANPRASDAYPPLDTLVFGEDKRITDDDRIMQKVRKLLALAASPNRHEAERAMAKAQQLTARYNLEQMKSNEHRDFHSICIDAPALRQTRDAYPLANILRDFYFVKCIWIPAAVLDREKMGKILEISGTQRNIRLAHYVHDFVRTFIDREWRAYSKGRRLGRGGRRDFALGALSGFRNVLETQTHDSPEIAALVKHGDPELEAYYHNRFPRIRSIGRGAMRVNTGILEDGESVGRRLVIHPGIEGTTPSARGNQLLS